MADHMCRASLNGSKMLASVIPWRHGAKRIDMFYKLSDGYDINGGIYESQRATKKGSEQ